MKTSRARQIEVLRALYRCREERPHASLLRIAKVAGLSERFTEGCLTDLRRTLEVEKVVGFLPRFVITDKGEKALLAAELGYEEPEAP